MGRDQLRLLIIQAVRAGNSVPSPFLHVTDSCTKAIGIWAERRELYRPMLVRFPITAVRPEFTY
eukprot:7632641-Lingulodinium_polyedra.AAC.1